MSPVNLLAEGPKAFSRGGRLTQRHGAAGNPHGEWTSE